MGGVWGGGVCGLGEWEGGVVSELFDKESIFLGEGIFL